MFFPANQTPAIDVRPPQGDSLTNPQSGFRAACRLVSGAYSSPKLSRCNFSRSWYSEACGFGLALPVTCGKKNGYGR